MAMANNNILPLVQYEGVQTVTAQKPTFSRPSFQLSIEKNMESSIFKRSFHMILCYNKATTQDSGYIMAGWVKPTLGIALLDQPLLAGRLRRIEDDDGALEIVANDSGIRLVEACVPMNLDEFIGLKNKEEVQKQLVFWENIDEQFPQFSPLMSIQVTNFKCGAYSIGISCSLLLADPMSMAKFVKIWAKVHTNIVNETKSPRLPIFYLPNFGKSTSTLYDADHATRKEPIGQTLVFKFPQKKITVDNEMQKKVATSCIVTAIRRSKNKVITSKFSLLVKVPSNGMTEVSTICLKQGNVMESSEDLNGVNVIWDDYIDGDGINITEGNKPVDFVSWISSPSDEGLAIITSSDFDTTVIVTIPSLSCVQ